jgi:hypothetical protein
VALLVDVELTELVKFPETYVNVYFVSVKTPVLLLVLNEYSVAPSVAFPDIKFILKSVLEPSMKVNDLELVVLVNPTRLTPLVNIAGDQRGIGAVNGGKFILKF